MDPDGIEIVPASEELRPFVRRYMYVNRRLQAPLVVRPKPTGYTYFVHFLRPPPAAHVVVDGHASPLDSRWHFAGQIVDHDIVVRHEKAHQALYCELSATGQHRLFGAPGEATTGKAPPLCEVANDVENLARERFTLGPDATRDEHVGQANAFFQALAQRAAPGEPLVEDAVQPCRRREPEILLSDSADQLGGGPALLQRSGDLDPDGARCWFSRPGAFPPRNAPLFRRGPARVPAQRSRSVQGIPGRLAPLRSQLVGDGVTMFALQREMPAPQEPMSRKGQISPCNDDRLAGNHRKRTQGTVAKRWEQESSA
jgi:hypothetical protein